MPPQFASGPTESRLGASGSTPVDRHPPRRRLVADDAAQRRRDAARAAGVGAERAPAPCRRRPTTAAPDELPPGNARRRAVPRAARRAVMRVDAEAGEGELRHVGPPDRHEPGGQHPRDHRRVGRGRCARRPAPATRPRVALARDVEQILQADRDAGIAARRAAHPAQRVHRVGRRARLIGVDVDERAAALAGRVGDARQATARPARAR